MGAKFSEESLQQFHICPSLRHGPELGGVICSEKSRVSQFDSSRARFQITGVHSGYMLPPTPDEFIAALEGEEVFVSGERTHADGVGIG